MKNEQTVEGLQEVAYQELLDLFEGDRRAVDRWLSSPVRVLGNHPPISLMGTKPGIQKIRNVVRKWSEGAVS